MKKDIKEITEAIEELAIELDDKDRDNKEFYRVVITNNNPPVAYVSKDLSYNKALHLKEKIMIELMLDLHKDNPELQQAYNQGKKDGLTITLFMSNEMETLPFSDYSEIHSKGGQSNVE